MSPRRPGCRADRETWCSSWKLAGHQPLVLVDRAAPDQRVAFDEPFQIAGQAAASPRRSRRMRRRRPALGPTSRRRCAAAGSPAAAPCHSHLATESSASMASRSAKGGVRGARAHASSACNACTLWFEARRETRLPRRPWLTTSFPRATAETPSTSTARSSTVAAALTMLPAAIIPPAGCHQATPVPSRPPARFRRQTNS